MSKGWTGDGSVGDRPLPLAGMKVVEVSQVLTGAFCSMMLADLGADVVKVERPGVGDASRIYTPPAVGGLSYYFCSVNRNKRSVVLDLKSQGGRDALQRIVAESDVLVANYRESQLREFGLGFEELAERNPNLIYCHIVGFDHDGAQSEKAALDIIIQAAGGAMSITGEADGMPLRSPVPIADLGASLFAAYSIAAAYPQNREVGGQRINVSMMKSLAAMMPYHWGEWFVDQRVPERRGNLHPSMVPYDCYRTLDGYVALAVSSDAQWTAFCAGMEADDLANDERLRTNRGRVAHRAFVEERVAALFAARSSSAVVAAMDRHDVPCAAVRTFDEVAADPIAPVLSLGLDGSGDTAQVMGPPYWMSAHPDLPASPPPALGEHTDEVLAEVGVVDGEAAAPAPVPSEAPDSTTSHDHQHRRTS